MKSYEQRTENITKKAKGIVSRRQAWISAVACLCCVAIVCGIVFATLPEDDPSDIYVYQKSDYFPLIQKISEYNEKNGEIFNWADGWVDEDGSVPQPEAPGAPAPGETAPGSSGPTGDTGDKYEESTLNQVDGVTEGDILKRSKNYAFYLTANLERLADGKWSRSFHISAYSIRGEDTKLVGEFDIKEEEGVTFYTSGLVFTENTEMYLSEDAKTLTLVTDCYNQSSIHYTCVVSLDVSQPSNISERSRTYVAGRYLSSRKVNGELLLVTNFHVPYKPDFDNPETFIPSHGAMDEREYWKMEEIYCPEYLSECTYTVVAKLNESDLQVTSKQAVLSYTYDVAVSTEHIFVIRNRGEYVQNGQVLDTLTYVEDGTALFHCFSEIVCLEYKDGLKNIGCVQLDGIVNDRYSLDEKDGILRVVTQTTRYEYTVTHGTSQYPNLLLKSSIRSASLHCVDLAEMEVVASVENFAPNGETVQAVRFNGDNAYVCTAIVNTDPVFVFDLSDIHNITYKDTGTIPGYSINLIQFGDYLLGIGYGEIRNTLKIELYKETDSSVESVAIYENDNCYFSTEYKAHFIDAEHQLVGLLIVDYEHPNNKNKFLLLQFDSETQTWREVLWQEAIGGVSQARAFYADGLYLICSETPLMFFSESALFGQSAE